MKGIILAGGSGTRLHPITLGVSKQLLPVFDKPMIYYPISTLMLARIRELLLITTPQDRGAFERLLGDGSQFGVSIQYAVQASPDGIPQALLIGREFIGDGPVALALGDNIFHGQGLAEFLRSGGQTTRGATVFGYWVRDPERYAVVEFDSEGRVVDLVEKPEEPRSNYVVTGLYFYDDRASELAESLRPSARGELEITDLNLAYLREGELHVELLGRGMAWLDTGTHESLQQASSYIEAVQERQGLKVACPEEIAFRQGWLSADELAERAARLDRNDYGRYLLQLVEEHRR
ncbi:MAG: glucose-1-phosphate thymidylyltransferase RfbA [Myxococcota bacterium]|nr:glucose-1-phosphate thymidylyltransferase RfbA [Myxococcota bacterium]